jgi:autotransporter-associated beta strand protein
MTGPVTISGGAINAAQANAFGTGAAQLSILSGGTLIASYGGGSNNGVFTPTAGGTISVASGGMLQVTAANGIEGWYGSGPWTTTIVNSGVMDCAVAGNVNLGSVVLSGGTMMASGAGDVYGTWNINNNVSVTANSLISAANFDLAGNALAGGGQRTFTVNSGATLNVTGFFRNGGNGGSTVAGIILAGNGTMILAGSNTYTGDTSVNGGTLAVNGSLVSNGNVYVNAGGILSGGGTVGNVQVWGGGAALAPGYSGGSSTLTASSMVLNASGHTGSVLNYTLGSVGAPGNSFLNITGAALGNFTIGAGAVTLNITQAAGWGLGTYELASFNSSALSDSSGGFSGWLVTGGGTGHNYVFSDTGGSLDLAVTSIGPTTVSGTWANTASGPWSWSTSGNWSGNQVPTSTNDTALFGSALSSGTATVYLDGNRTLSGLTFNNTNGSYAIATSNGGNLTLVATSGAVTLANSGGSHSISASVALGSNLNVTTAVGSKLAISGPVTQVNAGTSLSLSGSGTLVLSGSDSYSGGTTVNSGTLDVNSAQALPTTGVVVVGRNGRVVLGNITGAAEMIAASPLTSESISLASVPAVSSVDSSVAVLASSPAVQVSVPTGAPVSGGPAAVPEPGTVLLLLVGAAALAVWRRRRA